jgi:hypothetical protein
MVALRDTPAILLDDNDINAQEHRKIGFRQTLITKVFGDRYLLTNARARDHLMKVLLQ